MEGWMDVQTLLLRIIEFQKVNKKMDTTAIIATAATSALSAATTTATTTDHTFRIFFPVGEGRPYW